MNTARPSANLARLPDSRNSTKLSWRCICNELHYNKKDRQSDESFCRFFLFLLPLPYKFYGFFSRDVLNVESEDENAGEAVVNFML